MKYTQLDNTYRDDVLAEALYARELEYFHYDFDRANFAEMLKTLPEGEYRAAIQARHDATLQQMANVEAIYAALKAQVTDPIAHQAAVQRAIEKRLAKTQN